LGTLLRELFQPDEFETIEILMHLSTLSLTDVRQFEERTFEFSPGFNLLIGENGHGKTTIIRALLAAMGGFNQTGLYPKLTDEDIRLNRKQAEVEA